MTTAITFSRQNAGPRASNTQYWENLVLVVVVVFESRALWWNKMFAKCPRVPEQKQKKHKSWNSLTFYVYACTHVTITRRSKSTLRLFALLACKYEVKFTTILKWIEIICISKIKNQRKRFLAFSQNYSNIYLLVSQSDYAIWNSFLYEMNTHNVQQGLVSLLCRPTVVLRDVPFAQPWSESKLSMWEFNFFCFETRDLTRVKPLICWA